MKKQLALVSVLLVCMAFTSCEYNSAKVVSVTTWADMDQKQRQYYSDNDIITAVAVEEDTFTAICVTCLKDSARIPKIGQDVSISKILNSGDYVIK